MVDRNDIRNGPSARVALAEDTAASPTVSNRNDDFWIRNGFECALERFFHVHRYRAGYEQQIRMPRACDEFNANSLDIVIRIIERLNLQLAPIARAGIDVADAERTAQDPSQILLQASNCKMLFRRLRDSRSESPCESS